MLKSYLQALLNLFVKKSETEFVARQAMPEDWNSKIDIRVQTGSFEGTYIAPENGYFVLVGGNSIKAIWINSSINSRIGLNSTLADYPCIYTLVKKGHNIGYGVTVDSTSNAVTTVRFIPCVGK